SSLVPRLLHADEPEREHQLGLRARQQTPTPVLAEGLPGDDHRRVPGVRLLAHPPRAREALAAGALREAAASSPDGSGIYDAKRLISAPLSWGRSSFEPRRHGWPESRPAEHAPEPSLRRGRCRHNRSCRLSRSSAPTGSAAPACRGPSTTSARSLAALAVT